MMITLLENICTIMVVVRYYMILSCFLFLACGAQSFSSIPDADWIRIKTGKIYPQAKKKSEEISPFNVLEMFSFKGLRLLV